jgi:mRNA interferase RelE/StbE
MKNLIGRSQNVPYSLRIKQSAFKELQRIDKKEWMRVISAIDQLAENPHIGKLLKGELSGLRRIRSGNYRVIYEINEGEVTILVLRIAHRKQVYR